MNNSITVATAGKLAAGISEYNFEFPLTISKDPKILYETYHGVFVCINYMIKCEIRRSFLAKSVQKSQQFIIQYKVRTTKHNNIFNRNSKFIKCYNLQPIPKSPGNEINFSISPETLQKSAKERIAIPRFLITGHLDFTECCLTKPFTGHVKSNIFNVLQ